MIVVTGRVQVPAVRSEQFIALATEMCSASRTEAGCHGYRVYADLEQPEHYVIVEEWEDDAALQLHFRQPHTSTFMAGLPSLLGAPPTRSFTRSRRHAAWTLHAVFSRSTETVRSGCVQTTPLG